MSKSTDSANQPSAENSRAVTVRTLHQFKVKKQKISMVTAYDYSMARWADEAGIDCILVGDTLGMVVQGHSTTLGVTVNHMIYHGRIVASAAQRAMVIVDLPFPVGQLGTLHTLRVAAKIMKQTGCAAVKLEGDATHADTVAALVNAGIPVIAHIGLRPQSVHAMGGFVVQRDSDELLKDAMAAQDAGAFAVLIEGVPAVQATDVTNKLRVPTIGIGAGNGCDGQVLVTHDLLGYTPKAIGRFVRTYADFHTAAIDALKRYRDDVKSGDFPNDNESFK